MSNGSSAATGATVVLQPSPLELLRSRGRLRSTLALLGPAFVAAVAGLLNVILLGFVYEMLHTGGDPAGIAGGFVPGFQGTGSVLLATGILGATVMPHVIYLHSALTQSRVPPRDESERRSLLRFQRLDVLIAMGIAGVVNMAMLIVAASLFHGTLNVDSIDGAHSGFNQLLGPGAAVAFGVALLASGLS